MIELAEIIKRFRLKHDVYTWLMKELSWPHRSEVKLMLIALVNKLPREEIEEKVPSELIDKFLRLCPMFYSDLDKYQDSF